MNQKPAANSMLSHYRIVEQIGAGGMGEVYRAMDTRLDRAVAIKVLPASFAHDADRLRRFEQEARATSALNHPNIVTIYDIDTHEGAPFIVAELLEGEELREQLSEGALPLRRAVEYAQQMAAGLSAAHEKGIVHRDLKPENLFVTSDGRLKILDFGLAKLRPPRQASAASDVATAKQHTNPGTVMGTVAYMSPEQVRGQDLDSRSDIFSFGIILYEMLSGQRPFAGESQVEVMNAILKSEPPDLSEAKAKIGPALDRIVRRCLEKKPERRFQTASDLGFALESLSGVSGASQPEAASAPALVVSVAARRRLSPVLIGLVLAILAVGAVAGIFAGRPFWKTPTPEYQRLTFNRGTIWNARFAPDGQSVIYSARWNGNPLDIFAVRAGKAEARSLKLENADLLAISASNEMAVLRNRQSIGLFRSRGTLARLPIDGGAARDLLEDVQEADWSPDGTELAVARWVNGQSQLEYPVGKVLYKSAGHLNHPRISPKGDRVAFMDHPSQFNTRGWVVVVDLTGKKTIVSSEMANQEGLAWSPAGDEVWFTATRRGEADALYALSLSGQERLVLRTMSRLMLHDISRDGRVLLTSYSNSTTLVSQPPGESKERDLSWLDQGLLSDFSPDGRTILIDYTGEGSGTNGATYLRRTDGSPAVRLGDGIGARLSPDGKRALVVRFTPPQIVLLPTGAGEERVLKRGPIEQYAWGAIWVPDGKRVIFLGREPGHDWRCYVQNIESGPPRPITPEGTSEGMLISPDGRSLIASDAQRQRSFYPVEGGTTQPVLHLESADEILGWSGDGRSLAVANVNEMPIRVYRFDPANGRKELLKEIMPADPAGIFGYHYVFFTPDGKGYAYSVSRMLTDLYVVEGLK
ncbi:MAG TPA: protein kinase [Blastocatellia bacterium]|nr:protein kinase [Blastocatellia bacterium]